VKKTLPPILGPDDVAAVSQATLDFLRQNLGNRIPLSLPQVEQVVRLFSLAKRCSAARERRGLTIADVAKELKLPQYRLKAIESCRVAEVQPHVVEQYIRFLGLNRWFSRWTDANQRTPATVRRLTSRAKA
jgi:ribosome-binding protein aMBF1 (putative translation factor)